MSRPTDRDEIADTLAGLGDDPLPGEVSDADIVAGALAGLAAPSFLVDEATAPVRATRIASERPRRSLVVGIAVGVTLAAAAAAVLLLGLPSLDAWRDGGRTPGSLAPAVHDDEAEPHEARARAPEATARSRRRDASAEDVALVEPEPPLEDTSGATEGADAEAATGGDDDPAEAARRRTPLLPRTPDALLTHAQAQLRDGKTRAAMRTYKRLVERFPSSREAKAALVSMGRLALEQGQPKQALGHFDAYLAASAGPLVEEARYGRIRALRALGRSAQELKSIEAFLAEHKSSIYAPRLQRRAEELRAK